MKISFEMFQVLIICISQFYLVKLILWQGTLFLWSCFEMSQFLIIMIQVNPFIKWPPVLKGQINMAEDLVPHDWFYTSYGWTSFKILIFIHNYQLLFIPIFVFWTFESLVLFFFFQCVINSDWLLMI